MEQALVHDAREHRDAYVDDAGFTASVMAALPALGELSTMHVAHDGASALTETPQPLRGPNGTIVYPGFDADVLWRFRVASIGAQAILWAAMGLAFAPLAERVFRAYGAPTQQEMTAGKL